MANRRRRLRKRRRLQLDPDCPWLEPGWDPEQKRQRPPPTPLQRQMFVKKSYHSTQDESDCPSIYCHLSRLHFLIEQCRTPGRRVRSKGRGRGLAIGKGKGPIGMPVGEK